MMWFMYKGILNLPELLRKKSFFLFAPRSTGKSILIGHDLQGALVFDLLDKGTFADLLHRPSLILEKLGGESSLSQLRDHLTFG